MGKNLLLSPNTKRVTLLALFAVPFAALFLAPPLPQWAAYHHFADTRPFLGIPNFGDVASSAGFLAAGIGGLAAIFRGALFEDGVDRIPYLVFFAAITLVGLGSGYYHWAPSNGALFWDRLPMTAAFMSLFAAVIADRIHQQAGIYFLLPVLLAAGAGSLVYWRLTAAAGAGDLRFYGMVQFFPMAAIPVILLLYRDYRYTPAVPLLWAVAWYAFAKFLEHFNRQVFDLLGGSVSGHSLKHLAAAVAALMILRMLHRAAARTGAPQ